MIPQDKERGTTKRDGGESGRRRSRPELLNYNRREAVGLPWFSLRMGDTAAFRTKGEQACFGILGRTVITHSCYSDAQKQGVSDVRQWTQRSRA